MKKILTKSLRRLHTLLLMAVLFVVGGSSAWADKVSFTAGDCIGKASVEKNGVTITFSNAPTNYYGQADLSEGQTWTVSANGKIISVNVSQGWDTTAYSTTSNGTKSGSMWTAGETLSSVTFTVTSYLDFTQIDVEYESEGGGDTPSAGPQTATFDDGMTLSNSGSEVNGVTFSVTGGTYSTYRGGYNVPSGSSVTFKAPNGTVITQIELFASTGQTVNLNSDPSGAVLNEDKTVLTWNGGSNSVKFTNPNSNQYIAKAVVTYGEPSETDYTIDFVDAPNGASVMVDGTPFSADGTYTTNKSLTEAHVTDVVEPDGYYAEVSVEGTTITITYKAYLYYNVVVNGGEAGKGGVTFGNETYAAGSKVIETKEEITSDDVAAVEQARYSSNVSIEGSDIIVTYTGLPTGENFTIESTNPVNDGLVNTNIEVVKFFAPEGYTFDMENGMTPIKVSGKDVISSYSVSSNVISFEIPADDDDDPLNDTYALGTRTVVIPAGVIVAIHEKENGEKEVCKNNAYTLTFHNAYTYFFYVNGVKPTDAKITIKGETFDLNTVNEALFREPLTNEEVEDITITATGYKGDFNQSAVNDFKTTFIIDFERAYEYIDAVVTAQKATGEYILSYDELTFDKNVKILDRANITVDGKKVSSFNYAFNGYDYQYNKVDVFFNAAIYGEGEHTLVIPQGALAFYEGTYNELTAPLNNEITITYTLDKSYAYDVVVEGEGLSYDAGVNFQTGFYGDGSTLVASNEVRVEDLTVNQFDDYSTTVSIAEGVITVVYKSFNHAISEYAYDGESYWTTFCSTKPFTLAEDLTPYIVVKDENGVNTLKEIETMTTPGATTTLDFEAGEVMLSGNSLISEEGNNGIAITATNAKVYAGAYSGYLQQNYSNSDIIITLSADTNIEEIEITPYGFGSYGAYVSIDGSESVAVFDDKVPYTYHPNTKTSVITLAKNNNGIYLTKIVIKLAGSATAPVIPAGAGILIKSDEPKEKLNYAHVNASTTSDLSGNLLVGCTKDATWNEEGKSYFKLAWASSAYDDLGFYWGVEGGASINAQAGKAYLVLDKATDTDSSNRVAFRFGTQEQPTAIDFVETADDDAPIFNLQGKRVSRENLPAGVYVKNGRKFIVK